VTPIAYAAEAVLWGCFVVGAGLVLYLKLKGPATQEDRADGPRFGSTPGEVALWIHMKHLEQLADMMKDFRESIERNYPKEGSAQHLGP
jgi:hypothetical protein